MKGTVKLSFAVAALALLGATRDAAAQLNTVPPELEQVGIEEHLNVPLPRDIQLRDHQGARVMSGAVLDPARPSVLVFFYDRCPMLCSMVLNGVLEALRGTQWTVGDQFNALLISIDPHDGPTELSRKRNRLMDQYAAQGRRRIPEGWRVLGGDDVAVRRLTGTVGFRYQYDARQNQYGHPAAMFLVTPEGRVARYLYGMRFDPTDVRVGLLEASQGRTITTTERLLLFCYHYDPQGKKYVLLATRVMQLGGVLTVLFLGGLLGVLWSRERLRRSTSESVGVGATNATKVGTTEPQVVESFTR